MLKSLITFPTENSVLHGKPQNQVSERLVTYYELYKLIKHLNGSIVKCGISSDEAFGYFSFFKQISNNSQQSMVAFEKSPSIFESVEKNNEVTLAVKSPVVGFSDAQKDLVQKGKSEKILFVPGHLSDSIPQFLIENPELKIALLTIDLNDFETTLTAMQYLYPRLISGGILIINNYYKKMAENLAIKEYFNNQEVFVRHFSLQKGPHYIVKQ